MMLVSWCSFSTFMAETIFFLYKTGESMLDATIRPYIVQAVCKHMYHRNTTVCTEISLFHQHEDKIQSEAASYLMYYRILVNVPAIVLGLFCGAWSDEYGRKIPMMIPSLGSVFAVILYLISVQYPDYSLVLILTGASVQGIFGKSSVITMAVNSYAADITDKDQRTRKLGKLLAMNFFGLFAGSLLSGTLQDTTNIQVTLCVVSVFHASSVLTTVFCMEESVKATGDPHRSCSLFNISGIRDSLMVLFKKRKDNTRCIVVILFIATIINQTCKVGEMDVTVLFVQRSPLYWPESWYGYLLSLDYAVMGVCLLLFLPVLSSVMKIPDVFIVMIGIGCKLVRSVWAGFCSETWMVYTSVVIGALAGMITSALRSLMSKHVSEDELGKTFSLVASGETASKLIGTILFTNIYAASVFFFPGFAYLVEAMIYFIMFLMLIWLHKEIQLSGSYNLLLAFADKREKSTDKSYNSMNEVKREVDEIESEPQHPQPLPACTP
ncbi:solute carrier family 46 member 3-like [Haliotis rufescens]|uniref:solute carrier family 46 member 3-like n=1 Tax=Haliotis rufescens TaxID=6454 RepID=UPI001EAF9DEB|nr:solute carrier family 46 member 3-like [Haliotis rufescens]